ncbi:unnamed protein product [Aureobasidium vineae]|uniref:PUM-HD domain-containing protein n=1 Tax=Aureobasidium vineae TaxID=2773715 RepID=A0A9N8PF18_9PEZI|nr:unnamed protein product [Aureobasidium vineae]
MVKIALNQHGTRALQKMIEFISTPEQIQIITEALRYEVVPLIQDLNGNHVIQKCLNHLSPEDAQFIFDAVGTSCVIVGTHRHGCCVLQRCIDHASGHQKGQLVHHITMNAFTLVQDPFGNYVVQYILDLGEPAFSQPLAESFLGNVAALSRQKFSSNVIEKSIRTGDETTRRALIDEIMNPVDLEKLLRDSYANYVVQTAMDYADPETKARLIDNIRPILQSIRHTPYGRRISSKIQDYDNQLNGMPGSISPPGVMSPGQLNSTPFRTSRSNTMTSYTSANSPVGHQVGNYGAASMGSPNGHNRHHGSLNTMLAQPLSSRPMAMALARATSSSAMLLTALALPTWDTTDRILLSRANNTVLYHGISTPAFDCIALMHTRQGAQEEGLNIWTRTFFPRR